MLNEASTRDPLSPGRGDGAPVMATMGFSAQ
jgi:hypothetical protein